MKTPAGSHKELVFFPSYVAGRKGYALRVREVFQHYLKTRELVFTTQRAAILDHLLAAERHLSQEEIYSALKGRGIGRVTVFRMLKMLEECRLVERVTDSQGRSRYEVELERPHHDHLVCVECGRIQEIQWPSVERTQEKTCQELGFEILYHRHEVFGRCRGCRTKHG
ncbi:MAG TPA: transcriptional repressor [Nitrospiria bacterium]|nr:transcriptional repressor [Nitrospiria bacterium]